MPLKAEFTLPVSIAIEFGAEGGPAFSLVDVDPGLALEISAELTVKASGLKGNVESLTGAEVTKARPIKK